MFGRCLPYFTMASRLKRSVLCLQFPGITLYTQNYFFFNLNIYKSRDIFIIKFHISTIPLLQSSKICQQFCLCLFLQHTFGVWKHLRKILDSSHVWMWELDHKRCWMSKNRCFWIVVWKRLLKIPWTARSSQSMIKEINPEYSFQGLCWSWSCNTLYGHLMQRADPFGKTLRLGKNWRPKEKGASENEIIR